MSLGRLGTTGLLLLACMLGSSCRQLHEAALRTPYRSQTDEMSAGPVDGGSGEGLEVDDDEAPVAEGTSVLESESGDDAPAKAAEANNPLANLTALNFQNYYQAELTETDESANQFLVRAATPFSGPLGDWLVRATLPIVKTPVGQNQTSSGMGDFNVLATRLFDTGNPAVSFGVGPQLTIPTATNDRVGADQWAAGLAAVYFNAESPVVQYGGLATYQHKLGGSDRFDDNNILALQYFTFLQLGDGNYLRAAPVWTFNLANGNHNIPFGIGYGKVVKVESTVLNFFVEPQVSIHDDGPGQPEFQVFFGVNAQFY